MEEHENVLNPERVDHPDHYAKTSSIECIDAMRMTFGDGDVAMFCVINAYKYLWRCKQKNGIEDLKKAEWYLNKAEELAYYDSETFCIMRELLMKMLEEMKKNDSE